MGGGDAIFSLLGQVIAAGGGGAVVAYAIFRSLGKSWIESQLAKDLEAARSEIALLAARKTRLHDREYIVFPEVWSRLNKTYASLGKAVISFREIPNFMRMTPAELDQWLQRSDLDEDEVDYFKAEKDKLRAYSRLLDWRDLRQANRDFVEFHTYLQSNRIFLRPEIKEKLDHIGNLIHESWIAKKMDWDGHSNDAGKSFMLEAFHKYEKEVKPLMAEIENMVQATLFPESRLGS